PGLARAFTSSENDAGTGKTWVAGTKPGPGFELDRADLDDFGDVMAEHVLDSRLQGRGRARAARARALHVQVDDAVRKIIEDDVAAIHRHRRPHAGLEQFLDLSDDFVFFLAAF